MKWEYREYIHKGAELASTDNRIFAIWGSEGWELVSVVMILGYPTFYFKRLVSEEPIVLGMIRDCGRYNPHMTYLEVELIPRCQKPAGHDGQCGHRTKDGEYLQW